jgi:hypothetical protein
MADCAVDGIAPEKNIVTPEQATTGLIRWLERIERGEISTIERRDLNVKLTPVEIEQQVQHGHWLNLNDLSRMNSHISSSPCFFICNWIH